MKLQRAAVAAYTLGALGLMGCPSLKEMAEKASESLGVPFVVMTSEDDTCAKDQMELLSKEDRGMSSREQEQVRNTARHFKQIEIRPSTTTGAWEGRRLSVVLTETRCSGFRPRRCYPVQINKRSIELPTFRGTAPGKTQTYDEGGYAGFSAQQEISTYTEEVLEVRDRWSFRQPYPRNVWQSSYSEIRGSRCGEPVHLSELIARY